jgi:hypothetical protein
MPNAALDDTLIFRALSRINFWILAGKFSNGSGNNFNDNFYILVADVSNFDH